jgi:hypothetical protein
VTVTPGVLQVQAEGSVTLVSVARDTITANIVSTGATESAQEMRLVSQWISLETNPTGGPTSR